MFYKKKTKNYNFVQIKNKSINSHHITEIEYRVFIYKKVLI